jgi:microcin C transport system substrate-binding protein
MITWCHGSYHCLSMGTSCALPPTFDHLPYAHPHPPQGGTFKIGLVGRFDSLNPFVIKGTPAGGLTPLGSNLVHATLMEDNQNEIMTSYGYVAEEARTLEGGKSLWFRLNGKAKFHDGSPIEAFDVAYTFNLLKTKGHPIYRMYYKDVTQVIVHNHRSLTFHFRDHQNRELPILIGQMPILSQKDIEKKGFENRQLTGLLGSGPYIPLKIDIGRQITYKRLKDWWGREVATQKGRYNFDKIDFYYYRDDDVAFQGFKKGEYHIRIESKIQKWVQKDYVNDHHKNQKDLLEYHKIPLKFMGKMSGFAMNLRRPLFQNIDVRKALSLAFNFSWVNKHIFYGQYKRCSSYYDGTELASVGTPGPEERKILQPYVDQFNPNILFKNFQIPEGSVEGFSRENLIEAMALLKKAGWKIVNGALVHEKTGENFEFEFIFHDPFLEKVLALYQKDLKILGIKMHMRHLDQAQIQYRRNHHDYDMIFTSFLQSLNPGNEQRDFWGSQSASLPGSQNLMGIKNPTIDMLIEKLIQSHDRQDLVHHVRALDRLLLWGYYLVPGWYDPHLRMVHHQNIAFPKPFPSYGIDFYTAYDHSNTPQKGLKKC